MPIEVKFNVDRDWLSGLMASLSMTETDAVRAALTVLNWAVKERQAGRVVLSSDPDGKQIERLALPALDAITPLVS